ncbi:methyl-CpG-binding domain-containing protein 2 [Citrus sinensis]|uniref:MBD domain-containing protein n=1 Tax=Citrus clementina TaxID=85681 RepID=V4UUW8_CITCL|nr:methyl-CpG-binding domain-containing protein 2 [Citrus x clementina]XP_006474318.1 methyl-CpG-binding domain-containing protein 2 [Citrus sinensis]XP_006474319.1 methyl-CpG-binding domain-containing protein 2 [Citrus sinensis]XP_006474321.1 methyl-CpG-binding domain-containing protein 2 [Citrus sinensis]XP_006474322.1 methyl-CpG-binding domain-containing protein 2 [Citrus sinensis]XP_006474323.1 methyl-CpG-binding domain-containing protein 2 [Citrus sinensis]XP_024033770.1 methyl-CpG-bindi
MQSHSGKASVRVEKEANEFLGSSLLSNLDESLHEPIDVPSSTSSSASEGQSDETVEGDDQINGDASKQLVLYDPTANGTSEIEPVPESFQYNRAPFGRYSGPNTQSRVLPSVGAFTVQCADCFKWRLIPTKEKYEEIREHVLENPFTCEKAREWRPDVSCDDPTDISQDGSRLWAIDKPNIAQPPPGWQRLLRIRGEGSTKFADVYYEAPSGKKLRSMVEIQKYLLEHPEYARAGVKMSQFSFQIPKPLQENYVRKRVSKAHTSHDTPKALEPRAVSPLSWVSPDNFTDLQLGRPALPAPPVEAPISDPNPRPAKQARRAPKQMYSGSPISSDHKFRAEE